MEPLPGTAEELPTLYRTILTLVGELERRDGRDEADRIRRQAVLAYSTAWDERQRRRLEQLEHRLRRSIASRQPRPDAHPRLP